jgi:hypothetical protein
MCNQGRGAEETGLVDECRAKQRKKPHSAIMPSSAACPVLSCPVILSRPPSSFPLSSPPSLPFLPSSPPSPFPPTIPSPHHTNTTFPAPQHPSIKRSSYPSPSSRHGQLRLKYPRSRRQGPLRYDRPSDRRGFEEIQAGMQDLIARCVSNLFPCCEKQKKKKKKKKSSGLRSI